MRPVSSCLTGWLDPRCPNFSLKVRAPRASPSTWWPRQMPNSGVPCSTIARTFSHHVRQRRRVAGAVAQEHARRPVREQHRRRRRRGIDPDVAAVGGEPAQDVPLHAEVPRRHAVPDRRRARGLRAIAVAARLGAGGRPVERRRAGHAGHEVGAGHLRHAPRLLDQRVRVVIACRESRRASRRRTAAAASAPACRCRRWPRRPTPPGTRRACRPIASCSPPSDSLRMTNPATCGAPRLHVRRRDAVVADFRARHGDDLPGVGRVRQNLLVAGQPRVEHDFAGGGSRRTDGRALEPGAIFQSENGLHREVSLSSVAVIRRLSPAATVMRSVHSR